MRKRLEQLLNETFEYELPGIRLSEDSIVIELAEGGMGKASLTVSAEDERRIRAFVHSSNPRIKVEPEDFNNSKALLNISVDSRGLEGGAVSEGVITITSDLGEKKIPCIVKILTEKKAEETDFRKLQALAKQDYEKALSVFLSPAFRMSIGPERPSLCTLYDCFSGRSSKQKSLEEFLIGSGKKEAVELALDRDYIRLEDPEGTVQESLAISKNGWGFLEMDIESDARFLRPLKKKLSTEDFAGNDYTLGLIIDSNFLHAGNNYARVTVRSSYQTLSCPVIVVRHSEADHRKHRVQALMKKKALCLYQEYRLGHIDIHSWTERSQSVLQSYYRAGGTGIQAELFHVFLLQAEGKTARAASLLSDIEKRVELSADPSCYAAGLYLSTFFNEDEGYLNEVRRAFRQLYLRNKKHWMIRWLQMYVLEDEFPTDKDRLNLICGQIDEGCNSPILYMEGALILQKNPWLIHEWTMPVRMIINYAVRNNLMTEQLYLQTAGLIMKKSKFDPVSFRILSRCYEQNPLKDLLAALCTMAIAGEKKDEKYFPVYQAAVSRELTINGLYEYYMDTMGEFRIELMPQIIRRYFVYNDSMEWAKKARIYRNISDSSESIPQIYESAESAIRKFVAQQLDMGRINKDLAVLYTRYINRKTLNADQAGKLVKILFTFEIDCRNPVMKKVISADCRLRENKSVELKDGKAQIQIYSEDSRILLEDENGQPYASTSLYMAEHLLDAPGLLSLCAKVAPEDTGIILFTIFSAGNRNRISHKNLGAFLKAVDMDIFSEDYKKSLRGWLLDYYAANQDEESLFPFLKRINYKDYIPLGRDKLVTLLTQEGLHEEAYKIVEAYGMESLPLPVLVRICSQMVLSLEFEEKNFLTSLCARCFELGKFDENLLRYLLLYYEGPLELMKQLWFSARQYELDTMALEGKILSMIVFTYSPVSGTEHLYLRYRSGLGNRRLSQAYALLCCYRYLVKEEPTSELFFDDLLNDYSKGGNLPDTCALALLKHMSGLAEREKEQDEAAVSLLSYFNRKGMRFAFFRRFPAEMTHKLNIDDRVFMELVEDPKKTVKLYYRSSTKTPEKEIVKKPSPKDGWTEETMKDVFQGIRVREFVLFADRKLECVTERISPSNEHRFGKVRILSARLLPEDMKDSRYGRLCQMTEALDMGDIERYEKEKEEYLETDMLTRELFTLV